MVRSFVNPKPGAPGLVVLPAGGFRRAKAEITSWPDYAPTTLHLAPSLAVRAGVAGVAIKDEAGRFGLGSFKALGGAYAVVHVVMTELARRGIAHSPSTADLLARRYATDELTVTCATDGNHGRSVAWGAQRIGARCHIVVHEGIGADRIAAIERYGATVQRAGQTYDESVRAASELAARTGWAVVSDTSWPGYTEIPRLIMQGYRLMVDETLDQWTGPPPTHVFIQAGVGGVAASVSAHLRARLGMLPVLTVVEPDRAACLLASAERGALTTVSGPLDTIMDCLACGAPSLLAWQELERSATAFIAIGDAAATDAVRLLAGLGIGSQGSGAAGVGGLLAVSDDASLRATLGLGPDSRVLLFNTEGAAG